MKTVNDQSVRPMNLEEYKQSLHNRLDFENLATPSMKVLLSNQQTTVNLSEDM